MVGAVEHVPEAVGEEPHRRLVPARVEPDELGIVVQRERPLRPVGHADLERHGHLDAEPPQVAANREA